jgi:DNA-binding transcriptional ArsR family regulator
MPQSLQQFKAGLFRGLAHEVRVRILEELRDGERSVGDLQERLRVSGPNVSQHLARLRDLGIVAARREGTSVLYTVVDRRIYRLLDDARVIFEHQIATGTALLEGG